MYIIIPYLLVGIYHYRLLWKGISEYGHYLSYPVVILWLYFFSLRGDIRLFLFYGDQLFIRQKEKWLKRLMSMGMLYSFLWNLFLVGLIFVLILPVLLIYLKLSFFQVSYLFLFSLDFKLNVMSIKQWISLYFYGWRRYIFARLGVVLGAFMFWPMISSRNSVVMGSSLFIGCPILFYFYRKRMSIRWSFIEDVIREQDIKLKLTRLFIYSSSIIGGPEVSKVKRNKQKPFWFRKSNNIFRKRNQVNALIELYIKSILRSKSRIITLYQLTSIFSFGIVILPTSLKWLLWIVSIYILIDVLLGMRKEMEENVFMSIFKVNQYSRVKAGERGVFIVAFPLVTITSFLTGWLSHSFWWGLGLIGVGEMIGYLIIQSKVKFYSYHFKNL